MASTNEGWYEDMNISDAEFDVENNAYNDQFGVSSHFFVEDTYSIFSEKLNFRTFDSNINFAYIHDQDMNYYQESNNYYQASNVQDDALNKFNHESMLGHIETPQATEDNYDPDFDLEVNQLLEAVEEDFLLSENSDSETKDNNDKKCDGEIDPVKEKYEDYYDEFPEESESEETPKWYDKLIDNKVKETKKRLRDLSTLVCYASFATRNQIMRIEQDHNTPFCKLDYPKHPPLNKAWCNYWRFNCVIKCKVDPPEPEHAHTADCELLLLEHVGTAVTTRSENIFSNEFPEYVMHAVKLFQDFAGMTYKNNSFINDDDIPDSIYERPTWTYIKLRSNYKDELMMIVCGKGVTPLISPLKKYFNYGPGRTSNVVSLYCINQKWSQKKGNFLPSYISGCFDLRDKVGPISINYNPKTNINFNSINAQELGKIMLEYLSPTLETTVVDVGCNFGVLSLMMAMKSDKVIGLNTLEHEIRLAEELKMSNNLHNASFITCTTKEVQTKCSSLIKKCISVAVLNLTSPFGKSADVMKALRNLPSVWRVAVYGPFTKEFHKFITVLTSKDSHLGDEFFPMQGCILDKSPSIPTAFDIVVLFERKSLIDPTIELIAAGPTVNVKVDVSENTTINKQEIKLENDVESSEKLKNPAFNAILKYGRPTKKFGRFDSPLLPKEDRYGRNKNCPTPPPIENSTGPFSERLKQKEIMEMMEHSLSSKNKRFNCHSIVKSDIKSESEEEVFDFFPEIKEKKIIGLSHSKHKEKYVNDSLLLKSRERFDCPSLPTFEEDSTEKSFGSSAFSKKRRFDSPPIIKKERRFDCPPLPTSTENSEESQSDSSGFSNKYKHSRVAKIKKERRFDSPSPQTSTKNTAEKFDRSEYIKKEKSFDYALLPRSRNKRFDSLTQPINDLNTAVKVKQEARHDFPVKIKKESKSKEKQFNSSSLLKSKSQTFSSVEKEDGEISSDSIKSEPFSPRRIDLIELSDDERNQSDNGNNVSIKCESNSTLPFSNIKIKTDRTHVLEENVVDFASVKIKSESIESSEVLIKTEPLTTTKNDLAEMGMDDFENMVTPIHNPSAYANRELSTSPIPSTKISTVDGFQFSVDPNMSFLPDRAQANQTRISPVKVKQEIEVKEEKDTLDIDDEVGIISVKSDTNISIKKGESVEQKLKIKKEIKTESDTELDLRDLIEERKLIQKKLLDDDSPLISNDNRSRSPSSSITRRYRSPISPTSRRFKLSNSPSCRRYRSPISQNPKRFRSPSSPNSRYRSPVSPNSRRYRSPISPKNKKYRSPSPRFRSGFSPNRRVRSPQRPRFRTISPSRRNRSPSTPPRYTRCRSPVSPAAKRFRRSPSPTRFRRSPSQTRFRRSPSPTRFRRSPYRRSPIQGKFRRSPLSPTDRYRYRKRSRSPDERRRPRSPLRRRSRSPSELSPSLSHKTGSSNSPTLESVKLKEKKEKKDKKEKKEKKDKKEKKIKKHRLSVDNIPEDEMKIKSDGASNEMQWDIPGLSSLPETLEKLKKVDKSPKKSCSPAKSTSSISSRESIVIKKEIADF